MCGIAGIAGKNVQRFRTNVKQMTDAISHRGPDGEGVTVYDNCVLGHRRLSIIDLTTGDQPMFSPFDSVIVFNGEFYGFLDIKKQVEYPYKTTSDTELVLALYHQFGKDDFVHRMRGMYAFTIWDERNQVFVAARDRFGEKPFYYSITKEGDIIYASEVKAILASGLIEPEISTESLTHYLKHLYVHPHHSIYKNIKVLPPAHYLVYCNGELRIQRYWDLPKEQLKISYKEAKEECQRLLGRAVQQQLIADVPVGCFLSGGLDSSTITALAAKNSRHQLTTISFSFGKDKSELPYSREVSAKYNTNNIELHQDDYDIAGWFERMASIYDEPFADSSNIPTYLISEMAVKQFKVVLTGDGGDELMAGYANWYRSLYRLQNADKIKDKARNLIKKTLHSKYRKGSIAAMHLEQNVHLNDNELNDLCLFSPSYGYNKFLDQPHDSVDAAMRMDLQDYMPGDILVKTDRAAMASSLELRAPFLDVDFAEFCIALPEQFKINDQTDKVLLRDSFSDLWPVAIMNRHKQGFGAPVNEWLLQPKMQLLIKEQLLDPKNKMYQWLRYDACKNFAAKNNYQTWLLLTLALWTNKNL